jgi:molecular chaperone GrpE (heat shock protein)
LTAARIAILLLTCALQLPLCAQTPPSGALDIFLVVDNSGSMRQVDPDLLMPCTLSTFAGRLPLNSQLGILTFDKRVNVVLDLTRTTSKQFQDDVAAGLRNVNYEGSRSDLAGGVERAIYELRQRGRSDARRAIVLVTDGILDLGSRSATDRKTRWLREDLAAEARSLGVSIFAVTVSQAADFELTLSLARTTGGEYYRALAPAQLPRALTQVNERLTKMAGNSESRPSNPVIAKSPIGPSILVRQLILGSAIAITFALLVLAAVLSRKRAGRPRMFGQESEGATIEEAPPEPSLSALREHGTAVSHELAKAASLLTQANSQVRQFQTAVEHYALSNYKVLQAADEQCFTLARECVRLLDHLNIMIQRAEQQGEPCNSLRDARSRLCSVLETAQIEEMPVNAGDIFDAAVQTPTSAIASNGPEGVVVEVSRKGYTMKVKGRGDVILRASEVAVSTSQLAKRRAGGTQ